MGSPFLSLSLSLSPSPLFWTFNPFFLPSALPRFSPPLRRFFFPISFSFSLSFFKVDRLDGGGFFGRCWAAYGERRVLETVRIFLRVVCKTRCKDLGRMRIRFLDEVANNRGDFRSSVRVLQQRSFRREDRPRAIN